MQSEINSEKLKELANDTVTHKKLVLDSCLLMAEHFLSNGETQLAIDILKRGATHDNSKFNADEFKSLAQILNSTKCFTDADAQLSDAEKKAIQVHWKKNRHHPEYFDDFSEMTDLDMIEMVCDWFARSLQYGTKFLPFVRQRQKNRFHFDEEQFKKIINWCKLIEKLYKDKNETE
ncbi:MAG: hypothetical protein IJ593_06295 [Lachnospiraceae bacterium]|nr:hypothetical protein [Lachnospiraceae bacterium]